MNNLGNFVAVEERSVERFLFDLPGAVGALLRRQQPGANFGYSSKKAGQSILRVSSSSEGRLGPWF